MIKAKNEPYDGSISELESKFYKEITEKINHFVNDAIANITDSNPEKDSYKTLRKVQLSKEQVEALRKVIKETCRGVVHSLFVSIDGGTRLSDKGKALELINYKTGKPLTKGALHENFVDVLVTADEI